jgi:fatty acid desaturase
MSATTIQRGAAREAPRRWTRTAAVEIPTLLLVVLCYGGWLSITYAYGRWPLWVVAPIGAVLLTLHSSLQHEILHGHPTRWPALNRMLGMVPLSFWLPYERYKQTHLMHHTDARITDPLDDPESFYWTPEDLARMQPLSRVILSLQQTLPGRLVVGSFWRIANFWHRELIELWRNQERIRLVWLEHLLWCVPVIVWVTVVCHMPLWLYIVALVLPGNAILLFRSFAEHRARAEPRHRTAIVERSWILGPLYLFNNLHSLHHEAPLIPWYQYNARYRLARDRLIAENGGLLYVTYFEVARRFMFRPHDALAHPTGRVPSRQPA